ncbi:MAG: L-seryl-tRNA(Sec) selenium transferase, partial [Deltaproteobacteria bacterium]|nr:L-seryl-tRNA(Sec) selenium transferase [Deltaproteobacteria bacterium]
KLTLAALEGTMKQYLKTEEALSSIKGLRSLTEPVATIEKKARRLLKRLQKSPLEEFLFSLKKGTSMSGGGSLPTQEIPTVLIAINSSRISASRLGERLRHFETPIIARISDEEVLLDLRTIDESEFAIIENGLKASD